MISIFLAVCFVNSYAYSAKVREYYDEYEYDQGLDIEDEWFDDTEQTEWMVSNVANDEYDGLWENDNNWEQIDEIQTFSGNVLQRKCLHMWGQRLCLCQFLAFLDNRKFQCQPKGGAGFSNSYKGSNSHNYKPKFSKFSMTMPSQKVLQNRERQKVKRERTAYRLIPNKNLAAKHAAKAQAKKEAKKETKKIKKAIRKATKTSEPKMDKGKLKALVNKALGKAVEKAEKKETAKILQNGNKDQSLVPKHIPYASENIQLPKEKPKWLPSWMWEEFSTQKTQYKQEQKAHKIMKQTMKEKVKKEKRKEQKEIAQQKKVFKKAKNAAKKQIKKELEKEVKTQKRKAEVKTQKKAVTAVNKAIIKAKMKKAKDKRAIKASKAI